MRGLFDMDRPVWKWLGKLPEMIGLSLCWYICCIPLITFIPACCALYDAASRNLAADQKGCFRRFFRTFVKELKQGIPLSIVWLTILVISVVGLLGFSPEQSSSLSTVFVAIYTISIAFTIAYLGWLIPLQSRYSNSFVALHINALRFFIGRLWGSIGIFVITVGIAVISTFHFYTIPLLAIAPCLIALLHTIPVERGFRKAFPEHYETPEEE